MNKETINTPIIFRPKQGHSYHCDNYKLAFSPLIGRWQILLNAAAIITDSHKNWIEFIDCFSWRPWKEEKELPDYISTLNDDILDSIADDTFSDWLTESEIEELSYQAMEGLAYYTAFHGEVKSRDDELEPF